VPSGRQPRVGLNARTTKVRFGSVLDRESLEMKASFAVALPCKSSKARIARSNLEAGLMKNAIQKRLEVKKEMCYCLESIWR
jgi:hypothetical protein